MALPVKMACGTGVLKYCKISNSKHQITNKSQIPIFNDQNRFGISNFGDCDLEFLILHYSSILPHENKTIETPSVGGLLNRRLSLANGERAYEPRSLDGRDFA